MTDKEKLRYVQIGLDFHNIEVHIDILKKLIPITELILKKKGKTDLEDISKKAFTAGLKVGREETKTDKIRKLETDLKRYKQYHDDMEKTLHDPNKLADLISGL